MMRGWRYLFLIVVLTLTTLGGFNPAPAQILWYSRGTATISQFQELAHVWSYPPGIYRLTPAYNDLCLGVEWASWPEQPYVMQMPCGAGRDIAIIPVARSRSTGYSGLFTFRAPAQVDGLRRMNRCATQARGVILGPPRIDMLPCDIQANQAEWKFAGGQDQVFTMADGDTPERGRTTGIVRIERQGKCWTLRDSSRDIMGNVVFERCANTPNQAFIIQYVGPITTTGDLAALAQIGFRPGPEGEPMRLALPVRDIDMPGGDYDAAPTANDQGLTCSAQCAGDNRCLAFTWTPPAQSQSAMCYRKDQGVTPQNTTGMYSGYVTRFLGSRL